jgi:hypothetical protein
MFYTAKVAVCSEIRTKHINAMWVPCIILECRTWWYVKLPLGFKRLIEVTHYAIFPNLKTSTFQTIFRKPPDMLMDVSLFPNQQNITEYNMLHSMTTYHWRRMLCQTPSPIAWCQWTHTQTLKHRNQEVHRAVASNQGLSEPHYILADLHVASPPSWIPTCKAAAVAIGRRGGSTLPTVAGANLQRYRTPAQDSCTHFPKISVITKPETVTMKYLFSSWSKRCFHVRHAMQRRSSTSFRAHYLRRLHLGNNRRVSITLCTKHKPPHLSNLLFPTSSVVCDREQLYVRGPPH